VFKPCYAKKTGKFHSYSALPTNAEPCPLQNGCRKSTGWFFYYKNWKTDGTFLDIIQGAESVPSYCSGADYSNLFPSERKGKLHYEILKCLGLTKERLVKHDALFIYQLLLPFRRIDRSDVENDPQKSYYSVAGYTHKYAHELGLGGSYVTGTEQLLGLLNFE